MLWQVMKILHFVGLIAGVSSATVLATLFRKTLKEESLAKVIFKISRPTLNFAWLGLALPGISGIVLSKMGSYFIVTGYIFWLKLVCVIAIIGITAYIEFCVYKKARGKEQEALMYLCRKNNWLYWTSMALWYAVIILSVYSTK